ncbi:MAG: sugar transferase [Chitinophagales bacterium]|nr:sugar transferase [Chitinophagales bacterium]
MSTYSLAPIVLFVYARPWHTQQTLKYLSAAKLSSESTLYIFCDGPKPNATDDVRNKIEEVRAVVKSAQWAKDVIISESATNRGLANSIIAGVTEVIEKHGKAIILEDDLLVHHDFLAYMNAALDKFANNQQVFSITGYQFPAKFPEKLSNTFFFEDIASWSWATWKRAWTHFDPLATGWEQMKSDIQLRQRFDFNGAAAYFEMLRKQMETKEIDSWAIRWYWSVFKNGGVNLYPKYSLVKNIGFDGSGSHGADNDINNTILYDKEFVPEWPKNLYCDSKGHQAIVAFWKQQRNPSIISRALRKLKSFLG